MVLSTKVRLSHSADLVLYIQGRFLFNNMQINIKDEMQRLSLLNFLQNYQIVLDSTPIIAWLCRYQADSPMLSPNLRLR